MMQNIYRIVFISLVLISSSNAEDINLEERVSSVLELVKKKRTDLDDLKIIVPSQYDDWGRKIIKDYKYSFVESFDMNDDQIVDVFIASYSSKHNKSYLIVSTREGPIAIQKIIEFSYPQLCFSKTKNKKILRVISVLGSELEGDLLWENNKFVFKPYEPDY